MEMSNTGAVSVDRVKLASDPRFDDLVAIYREALPRSERKPAAKLAAMIAKPGYIFLVLLLDGKVAGFAIAVCFERTEACLIEYMAIAGKMRGQGLGNALFKSVVDLPEIRDRYLLAEVESEDRFGGSGSIGNWAVGRLRGWITSCLRFQAAHPRR